MAGLNEKQRAFCHEYIKNGGNGQNAYKASYPRKGGSDATASAQANKTLKIPHVAAYLAALRAPAIVSTKNTLLDLLKEYDENREVARSLGQSASMNAATAGKARLLGLEKMANADPEADKAQPVTVTVRVEDARVKP